MPLSPMAPLQALKYFLGLIPLPAITNPPAWAAAHQRQGFSVAGIVEQSLIDRLHKIISSALATGDVSNTKKNVDYILDQAGLSPRNPQRAEGIIRTEMMGAFNEGATREIQHMQEDFPAWQYLAVGGAHGGDGRNRKSHLERHGRYYPSSVAFADVRGRDVGDLVNCRCNQRAVHKSEWSRLLDKGAAFSSFAEERPDPGPRIIDVPDIAQADAFSCGAASAMAVGSYFGVGPKTLEEWKKALGTDVQESTSPQAIIKYLTGLGLSVTAKSGLTVADLKNAWRAGRPVICPVQDYGDEVPEQAEWDYGHYLTVIGFADDSYLVCQDSSADNVSYDRHGQPSESIAARGRVLIDEATWLKKWHDVGVDGQRFVRYGICVGPSAKSRPEKFCQEGENKGKPGVCPDEGPEETPAAKAPRVKKTPEADPAIGRPSAPEERHPDAAPKALPWKEPPPKKPRAEGVALRPIGDESQTALGDHTEELAKKLGLRNILPVGQRAHRPGEVAEKGSTIDTEFDHSGRLYEIKMCKTTSTEYRMKAKASEKDAKLHFAELHKGKAYTLIAVRDADTRQVHFYAGKEPGLIGAEVSEKHFDFIGTVGF